MTRPNRQMPAFAPLDRFGRRRLCVVERQRTRSDPAWSYGWMRRPECDTPDGDAWEKPDGQIVLFSIGRAPRIVRLKLLIREAKEARRSED